MSKPYDVVVIGGGIVGCSLLYALTQRGWDNVLLLEKLELTAGSTWHAAGNVTHFGHDANLTRLYVDSLRNYLTAEKESGQAIDFHRTGSLRLATSREELAAYEKLAPLYEGLGVPYEVVSPEEVAALHPLLNTDGIFGAAHTPGDGHVDPYGATQALAKSARGRGATILQHSPVSAMEPQRDHWRLRTPEREVTAKNVVLAASFWSRALAASLGLDLPLYPLEHHEVVTGAVPEVAGLGFELPTVRDPAAPSNLRQERSGFLCGVYEAEPAFWGLDGIPPDFGKELLPPQLGRLEAHLLRVMERLPAFGRAGIRTVNNGPICYTPDACPLIGPVAGFPGLWLASGFAVGIGTGGGAGQFLAYWMITGEPPYDLPMVYPGRFSAKADRAAQLARIKKVYAAGYVLPNLT